MIELNGMKDTSGSAEYCPQFSDLIYGVHLAANVAQSFTVPTGSGWFNIIPSVEPGTLVFFKVNGTATIPSGTIGSGGSALLMGAKSVPAGATVSMITSSANAYVSVEVYKQFAS